MDELKMKRLEKMLLAEIEACRKRREELSEELTGSEADDDEATEAECEWHYELGAQEAFEAALMMIKGVMKDV